MPTPDQSVKYKRNSFFCVSRELKAFLFQKKIEGLCFFRDQYFQSGGFLFSAPNKGEDFFENTFLKSEYFAQF